jgi:uncharacterized protein (DUF58 family)
MLSRDLVRQIRRLQIRARRAVEDLLGGEYRSVFKGAGISFEEVREYQAGDDIRTIDWNVTARMGHPFVKRFIEERELTVMLLIDCSASLAFGTQRQQKREVAAELAALLAFSAISNNDKVGLIACSDRVEKFVPPRKGTRHVLRLMRDILFFQPQHAGTSLRQGLDFLNRVLRRRAIVFLFSDFLDNGQAGSVGDRRLTPVAYADGSPNGLAKVMQRTGKRHDLIGVALSDPREHELPAVGLLELTDAETGQSVVIDTSSPKVQSALRLRTQERLQSMRQLAQSAQIDLIEVSTDGGHLDALIRFFRLRERRKGRL